MILKDEIENQRKEIHTDGYQMSIGEMISMYKEGDIDIHPEFQRIFRWSDIQKTKLIESILLGIPLPAFFVSQREDGVWDIVDGLQRLSTIFSFIGILKDENNESLPPLTLEKTKYLPSLEGKVWGLSDEETTIGEDLQRAFKRERIDIKIIKKESDDSTKYELFQRLNTGGSHLSPQEVRDCLMIMINPEYYEWVKSLSEYENFRSIITISENERNAAYDRELIIRYLICLQFPETNERDIGEFLSKNVHKIFSLHSPNHVNRTSGEALFEKTFSYLKEILDENAFKRFNPEKNKYSGGFSLSIYETLALGLAKYLEENPNINCSHITEKIENISKNLCLNEEFLDITKRGNRATKRYSALMNLGYNLINEN